ncbi:MAG: DinB family protein [Gemmatimonadaceae bacterium]|nr:DinB family protein [Gemmatimonadaceae bacterium]
MTSLCKRLSFALLVGVTALTAAPCALVAQPAPIVADMIKDVDGVQQKLVALAKAMPEATYAWRPKGARSVGEVFLHVASDNYLLPAMFGSTPPAATGINAKDFKTVEAYEKRKLTRAQIVTELESSFVHLKASMQGTTAAKASTTVDFFGTKMSQQTAWLGTTTHLHEHLGQAIAYARSNGVTPPWSK